MSEPIQVVPFSIERVLNSRRSTYCRSGNWSEKEQLKFTIFIDLNRQMFDSSTNKKSMRVFLLMAQFMKTRNSAQCRSHEQKCRMEEKK